MTNKLLTLLAISSLALSGCSLMPLPSASSASSTITAASSAVPQEAVSSAFYYDQLNQNAREAYGELLQGANDGQSSVSFSKPVSQDDFRMAV